MRNLRVSLYQSDIYWENKTKNLQQVHKQLISLSGETDLLILPEMFSTGFSMNSKELAETNDGETLTRLREWSKKYQVAICGSFIATENNRYYNRGFFITPGSETYFYDKKHLFRMGDEAEHFSPGNERLIIAYEGWNICLQICYDLRFPVWNRNRHNEYDLLIFVANWPQSRIYVWKSLLVARAIENLSYVCGVNRVGTDNMSNRYPGESVILNAKGEIMAHAENNKEGICSVTLDLNSLNQLREKFPVWKDADEFNIKATD